MASGSAATGLRRDLGLLEATTILVGSMIGSGIFLGVDAAATLVPSAPILLLVFFASGVLVFLGALTYGELSSIMPESGGHYAYIRNGFGPLVGFLQGWNIFTIAKSASIAALAVAFAAYLGVLVPMSALAAKGVAVALILLLTAVNVAGVRYAGWISNVSVFAKVGALVVLVGFGLALAAGATPASSTAPLPQGTGLLMAFGTAMVFAMFAYDGWTNSTQVAEEVRDPQRNVPRSLVLGVLLVMATYLAVVGVYLLHLGAGGLSNSAFAAADVASSFGGGTGRLLVVLVVLVSIFGTTNAVILSGPRIYFAMARDGVLPKAVAKVHPRTGTPAIAIGAQAVWSVLLALSGTFDQLLTTVIFMSWIFYGLGAYVVILWRKRHPDAPRPYRVPGYPVVPWIFVLASAVFTVNTLVTRPAESLAGVLILLTGLPVYFLVTRAGRRAIVPAPVVERPPLFAPASADHDLLVEEHLRTLRDSGAPWDGEAAAKATRLSEREVYAALARLANAQRADVRYADGAIRVRLR